MAIRKHPIASINHCIRGSYCTQPLYRSKLPNHCTNQPLYRWNTNNKCFGNVVRTIGYVPTEVCRPRAGLARRLKFFHNMWKKKVVFGCGGVGVWGAKLLKLRRLTKIMPDRCKPYRSTQHGLHRVSRCSRAGCS